MTSSNPLPNVCLTVYTFPPESYITLTSPPTSLDQFLRAILHAFSQPIVLILPQIKLTSQLSHCVFHFSQQNKIIPVYHLLFTLFMMGFSIQNFLKLQVYFINIFFYGYWVLCHRMPLPFELSFLFLYMWIFYTSGIHLGVRCKICVWLCCFSRWTPICLHTI